MSYWAPACCEPATREIWHDGRQWVCMVRTEAGYFRARIAECPFCGAELPKEEK